MFLLPAALEVGGGEEALLSGRPELACGCLVVLSYVFRGHGFAALVSHNTLTATPRFLLHASFRAGSPEHNGA